jgi:hypothetical protein
MKGNNEMLAAHAAIRIFSVWEHRHQTVFTVGGLVTKTDFTVVPVTKRTLRRSLPSTNGLYREKRVSS